MRVEIFTDGACRGNPGPGGWGVVLRAGNVEKTLSGSEEHTTNNRMELKAAIEALAALKRKCEVDLTTDSKYVRDGITLWLPKWKKNGWKNSTRKPVKNSDLWELLEKESEKHIINWHWIKGHAGHRENEWADQLANQAIDKMLGKK